MKKLLYIITILAALFLTATLVSLFIKDTSFSMPDIFDSISASEKKVAIVPISGIIASSGSASILDTGKIITPNEIERYIDSIKQDSSVDAVIFVINSPGGSPVASKDIADYIKTINKTKYAVIEDTGASGAYWVASSCDKIYANPMSVTGSIGVTSSYIDFANLMNKYGVDYNSLIAGNLKDMGSPYKNLTNQEREIFQKKINIVHDYFIKDIAKNRNISEEKVKALATGEFYLGSEAKTLNLIDEFGSKQTVLEQLKTELNATKITPVEYKESESLLSYFTKASAYEIGRGIGASLSSYAINTQSNPSIKA
jgi:protease-4